jgi:hypothetical protein
MEYCVVKTTMKYKGIFSIGRTRLCGVGGVILENIL